MQDLWGKKRSCCSNLMIHSQQMLQSCRLQDPPQIQLQSGVTQQTKFRPGCCREQGWNSWKAQCAGQINAKC